MSVPFVTGNVTATDWFILLYYRNLLYVNSGLLYLSCMFIGFGLLENKPFVTTADRLCAVLDSWCQKRDQLRRYEEATLHPAGVRLPDY